MAEQAPEEELTTDQASSSKSVEDVLLNTNLERLRAFLSDPSPVGENIQHIRHVTTKLLDKLKRADKSSNDVYSKLLQNIPLLLSVLKETGDIDTIHNVVQVLESLVTRKANRRQCSQLLLTNDGVRVLFGVLESVLVSCHPGKDWIILTIHELLAKVASKDTEFGKKAITCDGLNQLVSLLRTYAMKVTVLRSLLLVTKAAAKTRSCSRFLCSEGAIPIMLQIIDSCGKKHGHLQKLALDVLNYISRTKDGASMAVKQGAVPKILSLLDVGEKNECNHIPTAYSRTILNVLFNISRNTNGSQALSNASGVAVLYRFCHVLPVTSDCNELVSIACAILRNCLPKKYLAVPHLYGPVSFNVAGEHGSRILDRRNREWNFLMPSAEYDSNEDDSDDDDEISRLWSCSPPSYNYRQQAANLSRFRKFFSELGNETLTRLEQKQMKGWNIAGQRIERFDTDQNSPDRTENRDEICNRQALELRKSSSKFSLMRSFSSGEAYAVLSHDTRHVVPFVKLAYPDLHAASTPHNKELERLHKKDSSVCRNNLLRSLNQIVSPFPVCDTVVYDLDSLIAHRSSSDNQLLDNDDESRVGVPEFDDGRLRFESRFESGNLRRVIQVGKKDYELILNPDVNVDHHHQWFYFQVSNMEASVPYTFHIVNCEKRSSQFNHGMQPLLYSVKTAMQGWPGWVRAGRDICYHTNQYSCHPRFGNRLYYTSAFTIVFPHSHDVCYIAYHYPYPYSLLRTHIHMWERQAFQKSVSFQQETLCETLGGNAVPLITITSSNNEEKNEFKEYVLLTARVHPGETNSSWMMKGVVDYLLSDKPSAENLRENFIFKIVPMLNPDGAINGCHRCSLSAQDLNRCWKDPNPQINPTVYFTKALLQYLQWIRKPPLVFCDFHGHSRRKNVFLYGCSSAQSWRNDDRIKTEDSAHEVLPRVLQHIAPAFSLKSCMFTVEKNRESTARVTVWRDLGVRLSYTLESSYCGCDQGAYRGFQFGLYHLEEMGHKLCQAIQHLQSQPSRLQAALLHTVKLDGRRLEENLACEGDSEESAESEDEHDDVVDNGELFLVGHSQDSLSRLSSKGHA